MTDTVFNAQVITNYNNIKTIGVFIHKFMALRAIFFYLCEKHFLFAQRDQDDNVAKLFEHYSSQILDLNDSVESILQHCIANYSISNDSSNNTSTDIYDYSIEPQKINNNHPNIMENIYNHITIQRLDDDRNVVENVRMYPLRLELENTNYNNRKEHLLVL